MHIYIYTYIIYIYNDKTTYIVNPIINIPIEMAI